MEWIKIAHEKPPVNKKILIAYGYISGNEYSSTGYGTKTFTKHDLQFLKIANNGRYCFYLGDTAIAFWQEIKPPTE